GRGGRRSSRELRPGSARNVGPLRRPRAAAPRSSMTTEPEGFLASDETDDGDCDADRRGYVPDPEEEHPLDQLAAEVRNALLQLRVESSEVQLVQLAQVRSVCSVHLVERLHQLVRDIVAESLIVLSGQLGCNRHVPLAMVPGHTLSVRRA